MKKVHRLIALTKATDLGFLIFFFFLQTSVPTSSDSYAHMHGRDSTDIAGCTSTREGQGEYSYLRGLEWVHLVKGVSVSTPNCEGRGEYT